MSHESLSSSLLSRLRDDRPSAWRRLEGLYGPLILKWCRRVGVSEADAEDLRQEVLAAAARGLKGFRRERPDDSFRGWMMTITRNKVRDHFRKAGKQLVAAGGGSTQNARLHQHPDPLATADQDVTTHESDRRWLIRRAAELIQSEFEPPTWQACWLTAVEMRPAAEVAEQLGMTVGAVYQAKSRVLRRLRGELEGVD